MIETLIGAIVAVTVKPIWAKLRVMFCWLGLHTWKNLGFVISDPSKDRLECTLCSAIKDVSNGRTSSS